MALVGSLRRDSVNRKLAFVASENVDDHTEIEIFEGLKSIPPYDQDDDENPTAAVTLLRDRIAAADAVLIVTPEYNASVPGQLKNAIDWASRPHDTTVLLEKNVAVIGASPGRGGARSSIAGAQRILKRAGATVLEETFSLASAYRALDESGALSNPEIHQGVASVVAALAASSRKAD